MAVPVPFRWHGELILEPFGYFCVRLYWRLRFSGEQCWWVCVAERVVAHPRGFEANLGSEVVLWIDVQPDELGHDEVDVAHIHLPVPLCSSDQYFLRPPPSLINWWPSWLIGYDHVLGARQKHPLEWVRGLGESSVVLFLRHGRAHVHDPRTNCWPDCSVRH